MEAKSSTPSTVITLNLRYSDLFILPSSHTTSEATVSAPWMCEMSKHSMRRGSSGSISASASASWMALREGSSTRKRWVYDCLAFCPARSTSERFSPRCGTTISMRWSGAFAKQRGQRLAIVEVDGRQELIARHILLVDVELLQQSGEAPVRRGTGLAFCRSSGRESG